MYSVHGDRVLWLSGREMCDEGRCVMKGDA